MIKGRNVGEQQKQIYHFIKYSTNKSYQENMSNVSLHKLVTNLS